MRMIFVLCQARVLDYNVYWTFVLNLLLNGTWCSFLLKRNVSVLSLVEENGCYLCLLDFMDKWKHLGRVFSCDMGLLRLSSRGSFRHSIRFIIFLRGPHLLCYVACCKFLRLSSMGVSCGIAMTINYVGYV